MEPGERPEPLIERLETCFREIERTRMNGVPILNAALSVKAVGLANWNGEWLTVLVTPWFMNLMLLPETGREEPAKPVTVGAKDLVQFPAGRFEFIGGFEESFGPYRMCSLFSPVLEFADQATAEEAAKASLDALFETEDPKDKDIDRDMQAIWRGEKPAPAVSSVENPPASEQSAAAPSDEPKTTKRPARPDDLEPPSLSRRALFFGRDRGGEAS